MDYRLNPRITHVLDLRRRFLLIHETVLCAISLTLLEGCSAFNHVLWSRSIRNTDSWDLVGGMFDTSQLGPVSDGITTFMRTLHRLTRTRIMLLSIDKRMCDGDELYA
jgi:hypothetical protein